MSSYILIRRNGIKEAQPFTIWDGKEYISKHIPRWEHWDPDPGKRLGFAQHDTGEVVIFEPLIELFESVRRAVGGPIVINSGYRGDYYQSRLYEQDPSGAVAKPGHSPHRYGAAMDLALPSNWGAEDFARIIRHTAKALGLKEARTGWKQYGGRFVHMDVIYLLFAPFTAAKNPTPGAWRPGVKW